MNNIAIVIAHYHNSGKVASYLFKYVEYLAKITSNIVFVSTNINEDCYLLLKKICNVIVRENVGYDFWSYKIGIKFFEKIQGNLDKLIIMNSSIIILEPEYLMKKIIYRENYNQITSLTVSNEIHMHAQSFFIIFEGRKLINSEVMHDWWNKLKQISDRQKVIDTYEIGMSKYFLDNGYQIESLYKPSKNSRFIALCRAIGNNNIGFNMANAQDDVLLLDLRFEKALNPTHFHFDSIIDEFGIIKIELLKFNTTNQNISKVLDIFKVNNQNYYNLIQDALK